MTPAPGRRTFLKRACLVAGGVPLAAAALDGLFVTPRRLTTSDHAFGEPAAQDRLRLLQISDLHLRRIGPLEQALLQRVHDSPADLIVITGDSLDGGGSLATLEDLLRELPRGPRMLAIVGNWEHWSRIPLDALASAYGRHGVELLVNRSVEIELPGSRVRVTGLDDLVAGRPDAAKALDGASPCRHHLLLAHCPGTRDSLHLPQEHSASLVLSGHTHGGQVAPFGLAMLTPIGSGRYVAGWYRADGPPMYVSRGLGNSGLPVRIGSTPELVRIDWSLG
jgi:hypothetical protein